MEMKKYGALCGAESRAEFNRVLVKRGTADAKVNPWHRRPTLSPARLFLPGTPDGRVEDRTVQSLSRISVPMAPCGVASDSMQWGSSLVPVKSGNILVLH